MLVSGTNTRSVGSPPLPGSAEVICRRPGKGITEGYLRRHWRRAVKFSLEIPIHLPGGLPALLGQLGVGMPGVVPFVMGRSRDLPGSSQSARLPWRL